MKKETEEEKKETSILDDPDVIELFKDPKTTKMEKFVRAVNHKERLELQAEADKREKERKDAEKTKSFWD